jgi:hypothetical protein
MNEPLCHNVNDVLHVALMSCSSSAHDRKVAQGCLDKWEESGQPGYLACLLQILSEKGSVDSNSRLLVSILLKNLVGSSWRKLAISREWENFPDEEKTAVKSTCLRLFFEEENDQVSYLSFPLIFWERPCH